MEGKVIVTEEIEYKWICPKCGGVNKPRKLIAGQYFNCWQCGLRIKRTENGLWEIG